MYFNKLKQQTANYIKSKAASLIAGGYIFT